MEHFQENHMKALNELCRCCGNLNFTAKQKKIGSYPSLVCDRVGDILSIFDICVADDEEGKHSRYVCYTCVSKIRRAKSNSVGAVKSARLSKNNSSQIHEIEHDIQRYMTYYRQLFVNKTTPKHHILEKHCVPFLRRTRVGLGLTAEQGVEISHQLINKIDKRASGIMSDLQRSKFILEASLLHNTPNLRYLQKPKEVSD